MAMVIQIDFRPSFFHVFFPETHGLVIKMKTSEKLNKIGLGRWGFDVCFMCNYENRMIVIFLY